MFLPFTAWVGILLMLLIIIQILTGLRIIKAPYQLHNKILWKIILFLALIHMFLGLKAYF